MNRNPNMSLQKTPMPVLDITNRTTNSLIAAVAAGKKAAEAIDKYLNTG